ncbi:MAG: hypothetical protein UU87_C0001G0052 [Parcubacteria group bacterium GW2011_GWA2_42_11]|nr:MAG: hypothetical protein UU87_C0001G0052 [Parcubacteria group bacterium GW2011_GWA2_42_11]
MGLIDFIEKLQKKPLYVKTRIMWGGVAICMVAVFLFWFWSLNLTINNQTAKEVKEQGELSKSWEQIKEDVPTLWQSLGAGISNILKEEEANNENIESTLTSEPSATSEPYSSMPAGLPVE